MIDYININIIVIYTSRDQFSLIGKGIMKSPFKLIEVWWFVTINIFKECSYFEFLASDKYFFKTNSRINKIFPINNRFYDLYAKNILNRRSEFNSKIIKMLFFYIYREGISLLIFDLKIKIIIENILEIRYIKFPVDDNILPIIYFFLIFLCIDRNSVEINFNKLILIFSVI
jgi:hypothetical protein